MLKSMGVSDYHTFRLHYWDWRREVQMDQADDIFVEERLGETRANDNGQPQVYGDLFEGGWSTICWHNGSGNVDMPRGAICDPGIDTGPLLRCPFISDRDVCARDNPDWPSRAEVDAAIRKPQYDTASFNIQTGEDSFRNFMEGFDLSPGLSVEECADDGLCFCLIGNRNCDGPNSNFPARNRLHNSVST